MTINVTALDEVRVKLEQLHRRCEEQSLETGEASRALSALDSDASSRRAPAVAA